MSQTVLTLYDFITSIVGDVPAELESLVYLLLCLVFFYVLYLFFQLLFIVFGVSKWN